MGPYLPQISQNRSLFPIIRVWRVLRRSPPHAPAIASKIAVIQILTFSALLCRLAQGPPIITPFRGRFGQNGSVLWESLARSENYQPSAREAVPPAFSGRSPPRGSSLHKMRWSGSSRRRGPTARGARGFGGVPGIGRGWRLPPGSLQRWRALPTGTGGRSETTGTRRRRVPTVGVSRGSTDPNPLQGRILSAHAATSSTRAAASRAQALREQEWQARAGLLSHARVG